MTASGSKKLADFKGQEHITSVLRASIIKKEPLLKVAVEGDIDLAVEIRSAYWKAIKCTTPERGDWCGKCANCKGFLFTSIYLDFRHTYTEGFTNFQLKTAVGTYIDPEILTLLIHAYQSPKSSTLDASKKLGRELSFETFSVGILNILTNILYLKNNLEIVEVDKLEALRALSARMSTFDVTACIRILWDAQTKTTLPDALSIEIVSLLLSEAFQPTKTAATQEIWVETTEKPIKVIEQDNLEQPLALDEMLALARS